MSPLWYEQSGLCSALLSKHFVRDNSYWFHLYQPRRQHLAESECTVLAHGDDVTGVFCVYRCSEEGTSALSESGSPRTAARRNQVRFHRREANLFTYHSYSTAPHAQRHQRPLKTIASQISKRCSCVWLLMCTMSGGYLWPEWKHFLSRERNAVIMVVGDARFKCTVATCSFLPLAWVRQNISLEGPRRRLYSFWMLQVNYCTIAVGFNPVDISARAELYNLLMILQYS